LCYIGCGDRKKGSFVPRSQNYENKILLQIINYYFDRPSFAYSFGGQREVIFKMAEMYCVKCRAKREDPAAQAVTMKNGKPAMKGKCPTCGTGMYKIGG